ncbi:pyridoxamine 5'-phosphate oxidase family protein [Yoonia sp. R2331]|uniref:pyridoxamine 5'-phosphate oxidase family protein n=1 Tax=Yoonia sp. R2331 TaxID=3237238 RepID=UPI0034E61D52
MSEWFSTLDGLRDRVWETLALGVADADHPARYPTFATISTDGWPEARTVVLRSVEKGAAIKVFTDLYSHKIPSLKAAPRAALHVWDADQALQIRLQAEVAILTGAATDVDWETVPDHSRQSYGTQPAPGRPIADALDYSKVPDRATFAVLLCRIRWIDAVHLGADHRRAGYSRDDDWAGQWLSP